MQRRQKRLQPVFNPGSAAHAGPGFLFRNGGFNFVICQMWVIFAGLRLFNLRVSVSVLQIFVDYLIFASISVATGNKGASEDQRTGTLCSL